MEDDARTVASALSVDPSSEADPCADPTVRIKPPTPRVAVLISAAMLIAIVLFAAGSAVRPFVVGLLLAYLLDPLVERFARVGMPRWLAVLLVYAISVAIIALALAIAIPPLVQQIATFTTELPDIVKLIQYQLNHLNELYDRMGLPAELRTIADSIVAATLDAFNNLDIGFLQPIIDSAASFVTSIFGYLILPAWLFFLLKDRPRLQAAVDRSLPAPWRRDTWAIAGIVHEVFGKWVRGQLILGGVVGLASFIGLTVLGLTVDPIFGRFAVLLAIIAAFGELIPIIGPIISAVPAVLLGLTAGPGPALAALLLYLAIQQIENNVLVPKIQSDAIDLHPSLIITALIIGGAIFGLLGAILALPVTAAFRDVFKYVFRRASEVDTDETGDASDRELPSTAAGVEAMEAAGGQFAADVGAESVK
ncbi:MAG: AI-2E family transporter [Chloroflexota bacterium]